MLSKTTKVERLRKSREDRFVPLAAAESLFRTATKVCDRFSWELMCSLRSARMGRTSEAEKFVSRKGLFRQHRPSAEVGRPLIRSPRRRGRAASVVFRDLAFWRS